MDDELGAIVKERDDDLEEPAAAIETGPQPEVDQTAVVDGDGLGDLEEPDQLSLSRPWSGTATMSLRQARVGRRVRLAPPGLLGSR